MMDRFFTQSLSLLILLSVSGLNAGLSTKMSFSVAARGAASIAGETADERDESARHAANVPFILSGADRCYAGKRPEDKDSSNPQVTSSRASEATTRSSSSSSSDMIPSRFLRSTTNVLLTYHHVDAL